MAMLKGIAAVTRTLKSLYEDPLTPKLSSIEPARSCSIVGENDPMGPEGLLDHRFEVSRRGAGGRSPGAATGSTSSEPDVVVEAIDRFLPRLES